jgi:hypothetical protein
MLSKFASNMQDFYFRNFWMHFMLKVFVKNCNIFWVITNLSPLEKSHPRDLKKGEVREDIKELGQGDFESENWVGQGYLSKGNDLSTIRIHGCFGVITSSTY